MAKENNSKDTIFNVLKILFKLLYYIVIAFVCLIAAFLIYYIVSSQVHSDDENYKPRISVYTIISPSMTPNINVYDVVINVRVDRPSDIQVGDIITFKSTAATSEGMTITHRVIERKQLPDGTYEYMTQGDNNEEPDSVYVTYDNVIGKEVITIPYVGRIQFLIANQKGWLFLLLIPVSIYLIREAFKLVDLLGLRRRVDKVTKPGENLLPEKTAEEKKRQEKLKEELKENHQRKEVKKNSNIRSDLEEDGFLEKYTETIVKVKENKYKKYIKTSKEKEVEVVEEPLVITPSKVDTANVIEETKEPDLVLPKVKNKPIVVNEQYEILDTDELTSKIKEYDSKIEKLDKMLKDIENIKVEPKEEKEEIIESDEFLVGSKIKVTKIEETKNKRRNKVTTTKKESKKDLESTQINLDLNGIIPLENTLYKVERPESRDIKEVRKEEQEKLKTKNDSPKKEQLKLNPNNVKKINRKTKSTTPKNEPKLNLNPTKVKKINRTGKKGENKKPKKKPLIVIEKTK